MATNIDSPLKQWIPDGFKNGVPVTKNGFLMVGALELEDYLEFFLGSLKAILFLLGYR